MIGRGSLLYEAGNLKLILCDNLAGWDHTGVRREPQEGGDICVPMVEPC